MQNPIGEADLEWILHRNCEGTKQLRNRLYFICVLDIIKTTRNVFLFLVIFEPTDTLNGIPILPYGCQALT